MSYWQCCRPGAILTRTECDISHARTIGTRGRSDRSRVFGSHCLLDGRRPCLTHQRLPAGAIQEAQRQREHRPRRVPVRRPGRRHRAVGRVHDILVVRMDSGYYNAAVIGAVRKTGACFSVTARMDPAVAAAIAAIPEDAWTPIRYPQAIWDDQLSCWASDAEVAETEYTAFASKKEQAVTARLIVRRVRDKNTKAAGMDELFLVWRCHPVFTDSPFTLVMAEEQHRDHAIVEQLLADWTDGPMAHLPSGHFAANAAWLSCAAITQNLLRAAGCLASRSHARAGPRPSAPS
jgi:hypothetical protein